MTPDQSQKRRGVRPRLAVADQVSDAVASLRSHPVRSLATSLGVLLGVATAVATMSLAETARLQVSSTFDGLLATKVTAQLPEDESEVALPGMPDAGSLTRTFTPDGVERVATLDGVNGAGYYTDRRTSTTRIEASSLPESRLRTSEPRVLRVDAGVLEAAEAQYAGQGITQWHLDNGARVALVGRSMADELGIARGEAGRHIFIDGLAFVVVGVIDDGGRLPESTGAVVVPHTSLPQSVSDEEHVLAHVEPGTGPGVAEVMPYALDPGEPDQFEVLEPADPRSLREVITSDLATFALWLALVVTVAGMIGIASSTFGAVYERIGEFGLRRAVGATAGHLRRHVLTECGVIGLLAGLSGAFVGLVVVVGFSQIRGWVPVVEPRLLLVAPFVGLVSGLLAGTIPAWRAGRIEPADALRR